MILGIIGLIWLAVMIGIILGDDEWKVLSCFMISFLLIGLGGVFFFIISMAIIDASTDPQLTGETEIEWPIYSLKTSSSVEGSFVLGSGRFGSSEMYFAFAKNERGAFVRWSCDVDIASILEDDNVVPCVRKMEMKHKELSPVAKFFIYPISKNRNGLPNRYEFVVPKGTIIQKFSVE